MVEDFIEITISAAQGSGGIFVMGTVSGVVLSGCSLIVTVIVDRDSIEGTDPVSLGSEKLTGIGNKDLAITRVVIHQLQNQVFAYGNCVCQGD